MSLMIDDAWTPIKGWLGYKALSLALSHQLAGMHRLTLTTIDRGNAHALHLLLHHHHAHHRHHPHHHRLPWSTYTLNIWGHRSLAFLHVHTAAIISPGTCSNPNLITHPTFGCTYNKVVLAKGGFKQGFKWVQGECASSTPLLFMNTTFWDFIIRWGRVQQNGGILLVDRVKTCEVDQWLG